MVSKNIMDKYKRFVDNATEDIDLKKELIEMRDREENLEDAFYKDLEFGTGGLRGILGAGTNRLNIYTVAKASQGLADYINSLSDEKKINKVAISYDSRIKSDLFAKISAEVFSANNIEVNIFSELMPTPCLSYAVRELQCDIGVMITASHNPAEYNGYKVYGNDGCQITTEAAKKIMSYIKKIDMFNDVKRESFDMHLKKGTIRYIDNKIIDGYIKAIMEVSILEKEKFQEKEIERIKELKSKTKIIYTPLNGTGLKPVIRVMEESGFKNILVVEEQKNPDGNFTTCKYPNPEIAEAMELGIEYAIKNNADLVFATDPDCDRLGVVVKNKEGQFKLLSGNEIGILLLEYICNRLSELKVMPHEPMFMKSIVTTSLAERIATDYGVKTVNVLTGFKYIGEKIGDLEKNNKEASYVFGFEESNGYLRGTYVRDKDGVNASFLVGEMYIYYLMQGINLCERLESIYRKYGYCIDVQKSYMFKGANGSDKMNNLMNRLRKNVCCFGKYKIVKTYDYIVGIDDLPKSNILKFELDNKCTIIVRPSGTEPKLKVYFSITGVNKEEINVVKNELLNEIDKIINE